MTKSSFESQEFLVNTSCLFADLYSWCNSFLFNSAALRFGNVPNLICCPTGKELFPSPLFLRSSKNNWEKEWEEEWEEKEERNEEIEK